MSAPDAAAELKRALGVNFVNLGVPACFEQATSRPWASVTFSGARHRLVVLLPGPGAAAAADLFLDGLADRDFALRGHILADIDVSDRRVEDGQVRLTIEALTVEDV